MHKFSHWKWQPWKLNLTPYYCSGSLKTHESDFCFSGLPKFDNQGCHISGRLRDTISKLMSNDGQNTNLNYPAFRFFGEICLESCLLWDPQCVCLWRSLVPLPPRRVRTSWIPPQRESGKIMEWKTDLIFIQTYAKYIDVTCLNKNCRKFLEARRS